MVGGLMAEEKRLQTKILNDLRSLGKYCEAFKLMRASENGEPDIFFTMALTGGVLIEAKGGRGSPRPNQKAKIKKLNDCGTPTFVCRTWDEWMDVKRRLNMTPAAIRTAHTAS